MNSNFIPCAKWIKRGVAKEKPEVVQLTKEELKALQEKAKNEIIEKAGIVKSEEDQFNMEDYDKEEDVQSLILNIGNMIAPNNDDPDNPDNELASEPDEDDSDKEDDEIKPTDNLIAVGRVSGDLSVLEVYVFNEQDDDLYVHHDIVLPTIPLALEWLNYVPGSSTTGNLLALGGMTPEITVWDLDVVNSLEPLLTLGEFSSKKKHQHRNHGHRDAVLDLSWNSNFRHTLASGSVDRSVLLWDLEKGTTIGQFTNFKEKVQTVEWHPSEVNILMAGTCDGTLTLIDCRLGSPVTSVRVNGEIEKAVWHPTSTSSALVGTNLGALCCVDLVAGNVSWAVNAHDQEVTGIAVHPDKPESIVTCSTDQTVKLWSLEERGVKLVNSKQTNLGELHCLQVCPENPNIFCIGGNNRSNNFKVLNLTSELLGDPKSTDNAMEEENS